MSRRRKESPSGRLLRVLLPPDVREEALGDLEERYRSRRRGQGEKAALAWRRRQIRSLLIWASCRRIGWTLGRRNTSAAAASATTSALGSEGGWAGSLTDVRVAARALRRNPGYAAVAVLTLALGIGGNTAVLSVVDGVLFRPLPFPEASELVAIHETRQGQSWWSASPSNAMAWRERSRTLDDVAWAQPRVVSILDVDDRPVSASAVASSTNLLDLLEVRPLAGRFFEEGEDRVGAAPVTVLTYDLWLERYGGSRDGVGDRLTIDGVPHTVVGVIPAGQEPSFLGSHDLVVPRILTEAEIQGQGRILRTVGRLADGSALTAAREEMSALGAELDAQATPTGARGWGVRLVPLKEEMVGDTRASLFVLLGAVAFVLLIACANLSNLMLARGSARVAGVAVRASLGAGRGRLVGHLLTESLLIAVAGGILGLGLAVWGTKLLLSVDPGVLPRLQDVTPDARSVAFTAALSVLAALLFGLMPALRASRVDLSSAIQGGGGRRGVAGRGEGRLRDGLVAAEVGLVIVLLAGAATMVGTVRSLAATDPGFQTEGRLAVRLTLPESRYPDHVAITRFVTSVTQGIEAIPGVVRAGSVSTLPLTGSQGYTAFHLARSLPTPEAGAEPIGGMEIVGPGYFEAMGIELLAGRTVQDSDLHSGESVVVVDEGVVANLGSPETALTDAVRTAPPGAGPISVWREIVGVVNPVRYGLDAQARPRIYIPEGQATFVLRPRTVVVRVEPGARESVIPAVRAAVADVDPVLSIRSLQWLDEVAHASISRSRLQSTLLSVFALVAVLLGAVGVYGVVAYTVAQKRREVGLRLALGASPAEVVRSVVRRSMAPVLVGVAGGLVGAVALTSWLGGSAFGLQTPGPVALMGVPLVLVPLAFLAALIPGRQAARVDPVRALRE